MTGSVFLPLLTGGPCTSLLTWTGVLVSLACGYI